MIFFFKCTPQLLWNGSLVLQTIVPKMPAVRNESDQEISWDMLKDGFNFLSLDFLTIFCICTTRDSWNKPIFNIRHYEICKWGMTLQIVPPSHTCSQSKVCYVKFLCIVKRSKISGISSICIRAKCRVTSNRNTSRNVHKICCNSTSTCCNLTSCWHVEPVMTSFVCFPLSSVFSFSQATRLGSCFSINLLVVRNVM